MNIGLRCKLAKGDKVPHRISKTSPLWSMLHAFGNSVLGRRYNQQLGLAKLLLDGTFIA